MSKEMSVSNILNFSFTKTRSLLFPFKFKKWLKLMVIIWLAGGYVSSGCNLDIPNLNRSNEEAQGESAESVGGGAETSEAQGPNEESPETEVDELESVKALMNRAQSFARENAVLISSVGGGLLLSLILLMSWLLSHFRFIFIRYLAAGDMKISKNFSEYHPQAMSYFWWSWILGFAFITPLVGYGVYVWMTQGQEGFASLSFIGPMMIMSFGFLLVIGIAYHLVDFILGIMYRDRIALFPAISAFMKAKPSIGNIFIYLLLKLGLGIISMILMAAISMVVLIVLLLIAVLPIVLIFIAAGAIKFLQVPLVILGILAIFALMLLITGAIYMLALPIPVFFMVYTLTYLKKLIPEYDLLGFDSPDQ